MPGQDRIESLVNKTGIEQEFAFVESGLGKIELRLGDIKSMILGLDTKIDLAKNMGLKDTETVTRELTKAQQDAEKSTLALLKVQKLKAEIDLKAAQAAKVKQDAEIAANKELDRQIALEEKARIATDKKAEADRKAAAAAKQKEDAQSRQQYIDSVPFEIKQGGDAPIDSNTAAALDAEKIAYDEATNSAYAYGESQSAVVKGSKEEVAAIDRSTEEYELQLTPLEESIKARDELKESNKQLADSQKQDAALLKAKKIDQVEYNKRIAESSAAIEVNKNKLQLVNRELKANAILENQSSTETDKLRARLTLLTIQYERLTVAQQKSAKGVNIQQQAAAIAKQIDLTQSSVGNYTKNVGNYFSKVFGGLRTLANILPGIGLAGLFGLLFEGLSGALSKLELFEGAAKKTGRQIDALRGFSDETKKALKEMGDTVEEISDKALENMESAIKNLNKELGNMPDEIEASLAAIELLKGKSAEAENNLKKLSQTTTLQAEALSGASVAQAIYKEQIRQANEAITEQISKQTELNRLRGLKELEEQSKFLDIQRIQEIEDRKFLNDIELKDAANVYVQKKALTENGYKIEKDLLTQQKFDELRLTEGNTIKQQAIEEKYRSLNMRLNRKNEEELYKLRLEYLEKVRKAEFEIQSRIQNDRISFNEKTAADTSEPFEVRINAMQKQGEAIAALLNEQEQDELSRLGLEEKQKQAIRDKYEALRFNKAKELGEKIFKLAVENSKREKFLEERFLEQREDLKKAGGGGSQGTNLITNANGTQQGLNPDGTLEIGNKNAARFFKQVTDGANEANEAIRKLQFEGDKFAQMLSRMIPKEAGENIDDYVKKIKDIEKALTDLGAQVVGAVQDAFEAGFINQKNEIQDQIDKLDEKKLKEIEVANSSIANEEKRAAAISSINARAEAQKAVLEAKQRAIDVRKAKFDKAVAVAAVIFNTAQAVTAALTSKPPNVILAGVVGAIGVINAARIAAAPIPRYWKGTDNHPGGDAIVGDGGRAEGLTFPDGSIMKTPAVATVMNLPAGTRVDPDWEKMVSRDVMYIDERGKLVDNAKMMSKGFRSIVRAIKGKQELHLHDVPRHKVLLQKGNSFSNYLGTHV